MATRLRSLLPLALSLALGLPLAASAQLRAPTLVDETEGPPADEPPERPARPAPRDEERRPPRAPEVQVPLPRAEAPPPPAQPAAKAPELPPPPPPPTASVDLARQIQPVRATWAKLEASWKERRAAQREQDPGRAAAAERAVLEVKRELALENLFTHAASEVREARRALGANLPGEALAHAELAARLAPDLPDAHLTVARARFASDAGDLLPVLGALRDAFGAAAREPHVLRAFAADVLSAALAALFTASTGTIVLLFLRRVRLFLHDFHHLPLLRGTAPIQTGFLALVLLALPTAFGLGAFATVAVLVLAVWLHLGMAERAVATVALAVLVVLPAAGAGAARLTAWTGSPAEIVHALEHAAVPDEEVAEIAARAGASPAPAPVYAALGRHAKRRGDLEGALRWYQAADADGRAPEVQVNVGNVLFLKGDLEGAKAAYLAATDRARGDVTTLAAAHYNLAKLYLRTADVEKSAAALGRAQQEDGEFIRRNAADDDDMAANRYLADVPVPVSKIAALAAADASPDAVRAYLVAQLGGALPRASWPVLPVAFVVGLWALALGTRNASPSRACAKCGRAACRRCDGAPSELCGQCVNVFQRRGVVDARDRLRKEAQVRAHQRLERNVTRVLAVLGGGAGHVYAGAPVRGFALVAGLLFAAFVVVFWQGVLPPPQPSAYVFVGKLAFAIPAAALLYFLAVRDAFRRTE